MNLYPDWTLFIQLIFFGACYWMLKTLVFPPVLRIIRKRQSMVEHAQKELVEREEEGREMQRSYDAKIRDIRMQAQQIRNEARQQASDYERAQQEQTRSQEQQLQEKERREIEALSTKLSSNLEREKKALGQSIASSLLGRSVS